MPKLFHKIPYKQKTIVNSYSNTAHNVPEYLLYTKTNRLRSKLLLRNLFKKENLFRENVLKHALLKKYIHKRLRHKLKKKRKHVLSFTKLSSKLKKSYSLIFSIREPYDLSKETITVEAYLKKAYKKIIRATIRFNKLTNRKFAFIIKFSDKNLIVVEVYFSFFGRNMKNNLRKALFIAFKKAYYRRKKWYNSKSNIQNLEKIIADLRLKTVEELAVKDPYKLVYHGFERKMLSKTICHYTNGALGYKNNKKKTKYACEKNIIKLSRSFALANPRFFRLNFTSRIPYFLRRKALLRHFTRTNTLALDIRNSYRRAHGYVRTCAKQRK